MVMLDAADLWRYTRDVKVGHAHGCPCCLRMVNSTLQQVERVGTVNHLHLECGCAIPAPDGSKRLVEVIWHPDVLGWGKRVGSPSLLLI